jgi:hypothetical protein
MVTSGLRTSDITPGATLWLCANWLDPDDDFHEVRAIGVRHSRVDVEVLSGPRARQRPAVYASRLWADDLLEHARDCRGRDMRIDALDAERPGDSVTDTAGQLCCLIATGDIVADAGRTRGLLRRLGRGDDLAELHELAYTENDTAYASVVAPVAAWSALFEAFAAAEPERIDERIDDACRELSWHDRATVDSAAAMVRRWAGLPPRPVRLATSDGDGDDRDRDEGARGGGDDVARLRALIELAAGMLDDAGRPDHALNLRRAAFPHRYSARD